MSIARKEKSERKKSNNKINMNERRNIAISRKSKQDKQEQKKVYKYFIFEQKKKKYRFYAMLHNVNGVYLFYGLFRAEPTGGPKISTRRKRKAGRASE